MENSKFELFQKHKLENLHAIIGGSKATVGTGSMEGHGDTFYYENEYKHTTRDTDYKTGKKGDVYFAMPDGGEEEDTADHDDDWDFEI